MKVVGGINDDKITAALRSGNGPDVVSSFTSPNVGIYCKTGRLDRPRAVPEARQDRRQHVPGRDAVLHAVPGQALCAAAARRRVRLLLQQGALQEGRAHASAEDAGRADGVREEADQAATPTGRSRSSATTRCSASTRTRSAPTSRSSGRSTSTRTGKSSLAKDPAWSKLLRWQKSLVDYYGHDKLVKWQTGAGDEFSASHAFERGKLAMMMDGEWRVAFIAAEHPEPRATAPRRCRSTGKKNLYGAGYINGTIIGIPKNGKNRDAGVGARQVPDDERPRAGDVLERHPQRALDALRGEVAELKPDTNFADVHEDLREPELADDPDHRDRLGVPRDVHELPRQVAGRQGEGPAGRPAGGRQADRREAEAGGRRQCREPGLAGQPGRTPPRPGRRSVAGEPGGGPPGGAAAPCSLFLSPWLVGFSVFFGYPLVMTRLPLVHRYDLLSPPRWVGLANYRYLFDGRPPGLAGGRQHALADRRRSCRCRCCSRSASRVMLTRAPRGVGVFRTIFYLPALVPPVAATLGFVYLLNPATGPVNTMLGRLGIEGPLWFNDPGWSKPSLVLLGAVGHRHDDDHLPRRDPRRAAAPARVGGARRRRRVPAAALGDAADDQPGDPVRRRARRDRGRCSTSRRRYVAASVAAGSAVQAGTRARSSSATPRARRSSTRSSSTTTASASSTWATRRRWRCCCSSSRSR